MPLGEDDLLSVTAAAKLAGRSTRTIRRAYRAGVLVAYRDGNGRGVRVRYGDLRQWMMDVRVSTSASTRETATPLKPHQHLEMAGKVPAGPSEYVALLNAARARQRGRAIER